jgi:hypothetical protein
MQRSSVNVGAGALRAATRRRAREGSRSQEKALTRFFGKILRGCGGTTIQASWMRSSPLNTSKTLGKHTPKAERQFSK